MSESPWFALACLLMAALAVGVIANIIGVPQ